MKYRQRALASCLALASTVVSAQGGEEDAKSVDSSTLPPVAEEGCFIARNVRNFEPLGDDYVWVEARGDDKSYLLTMFNGCFGLRDAIGIVISSDMSRVCSNSGAKIRYRGFGRRESCQIRKVEAVEDREAAKRIVELRSQ